ncbi:MAG: hypothetical protein ACRCUE_01985 [Bosea sp. (in: a-proteobacteria)]
MSRMHSMILGLTVSMLTVTAAIADKFIIGLPKYGGDKKALETAISTVFTGMRPGDTLGVYNAPERQRLAQINLPTDQVQTNQRLRVKLFGAQLAPIGAFMTAASTAAATPHPSNIGFPQFLRELGNTVMPTMPGKTLEVAVIGSAKYDDKREPKFSMLYGHFPTDGHFRVDDTVSPYGTANRANTLKGATIHFCITDKEWIDDLHRQRVQRFWTLYVEQLGGKLATFTNDLALCTQRLLAKNTDGGERYTVDPRQTKAEMLRIVRGSNRTSEAPTAAPPQVATFEQGGRFMDQGVVLSTTPPASSIGRVKIGIRWDCSTCDLDLYARASAAAPFLFYDNQISAEGRHQKDWRNSPDAEKQHEYIDLPRPVDLNNLEVYLHFYEGRSPGGARGVLRIWIEGKVYEQVFVIPATTGNQRGSFRPDLMRGPEWARVDVRQVVSPGRS